VLLRSPTNPRINSHVPSTPRVRAQLISSAFRASPLLVCLTPFAIRQTLQSLSDFAEVRRQLRTSKHLTVQSVWEDCRGTQRDAGVYCSALENPKLDS
jgi:hypothetical protein